MASIRTHSTYDRHGYTYYPVAIIGAGESGIAMGCQLKQQLKFDQFRIFERRSGIGGTWWSNRYPGVACDIPAMLYSFSFAQNPKWTSTFPSGKEIAEYLADVCAKFEIVDKLQFHTEVTELKWLEDEEEWELTITHLVPGVGDWSEAERQDKIAAEGPKGVYLATEKIRAKIAISAVGGLVEPQVIPKDIPGFGTFEGEITHTARWDDDLDVNGKDVVVLGAGASAAQVVSSISSTEYNVKSVTQLLRTAPWVRPDDGDSQPVDEQLQKLSWYFQYIPGFHRAYRSMVFFFMEHEFFLMFSNTSYTKKHRPLEEEKYRRFMKKTAPAKYHDLLTPDYDLGCKRRIIGGEWLRSLHRPKVNLTSRELKSVNARSVILGAPIYPRAAKTSAESDEVELPADVIILANGYRTNEYLHPIRVIGKDGRSIHEIWEERGGPQAYLGVAMDKFPNFFMIFGPNTVTGHTSVILASENAITYTMKLIKPILKGTVSTWEIKEDAEREWTTKVQTGLKQTPFNNGSCTSWYTNDKGWNSTAYPFSQIDYGLRCMFPVWKHWQSKLTPEGLRQRNRKTRIRRFALALAVAVFIWRKKNPLGAQTIRSTIVQAISKTLKRQKKMNSESPNPHGNTPQASGVSSNGDAKRKAGPDSGTQTRAKRNRYISIAWEFRAMKDQIDTLQTQVNTLFTSLNELSTFKTSLDSVPFDQYSTEPSRTGPISTSQEEPSPASPPQTRHPRFHGPTSSAFNFGVARVSLRDMGLTSTENPIHDDLAATAETSSLSTPMTRLAAMHPTKDPIWAITREEAVRLCRVYEEEIGLMYPFFNIEKVISQTNLLYNFLEAATRTGLTQTQLPGLDGLQDDDSLNLKMILATTLVLEGGGQSTLARQLFDTVKPVFYTKTLEPANIKTIQLFSIMAMYYFHTDNELMCYRITGMNARACLELGLHRWDAVIKAFPAESDWTEITLLFWAIYNLDRRFSFGTGLPFAIPDSDIDPSLPEPDDSRPYSKSMVAYDRLSSKIWYSGVGYEGSTDVNREEIGFLDYQVFCHAPGEFSREVRDEFYLALDLINGFSAHSYISMRLWNSIKGLRKIAEKLGVFGRNTGTDARDPHSSAAVAMAGLAGHPMENMSVYGPTMGTISELGNSPMNGLQISHELTNLFEAVGATNSFGADNLNGFISNDGDLQNSGEGLAGVLSSDAEFSRILSGLI
ncbi:hypothetical protein ZTR_06147 [Talaromyces verruculosus]|nr:hypothetical protein ZTR_06147 [Talaromyces verruculosus]